MEVKINREIRDFTERVVLGLTLRQALCTALALFAAAAVYFLLGDTLGSELLSWACARAAGPFAALGFVQVNGMSCEQLIGAFIRCEVLSPHILTYRSEPFYYQLMSRRLREYERKGTAHAADTE